ncbi:MAG: hypothetical protein JWN78_2258 [Bacteroidota bacterium]|nr:hypothetical protein [Bacteroidota bacterium]
MIRIFSIIPVFFISSVIFGQSETFDKKVEQLFYNKHVYDNSMSLIDTLAAVKDLSYGVPKLSDNVTPIGVVNVRRHVFEFKQSPYVPIVFDKGMIILEVQEKGKEKLLKDITWQLEFENKEAAIQAFTELEKYFSVPGTTHKVYKTGVSLSTAEFTDHSSKQYPHIMFVLLNNRNDEKKYKIRLFPE